MSSRHPIPSDCRGFTLIELLVAVAILGVAAVMGYKGLAMVLTGSDTLQSAAGRLAALQTTRLLLERDLSSIVEREVRDALGGTLPAFQGSVGKAPAMEFTMLVSAATTTSSVEVARRIGYRLHDGALERLVWPVLDRAPLTTPRTTRLIDGVKRLQLRYLGAARWQTVWPPAQPTALPGQPPAASATGPGAAVLRKDGGRAPGRDAANDGAATGAAPAGTTPAPAGSAGETSINPGAVADAAGANAPGAVPPGQPAPAESEVVLPRVVEVSLEFDDGRVYRWLLRAFS